MADDLVFLSDLQAGHSFSTVEVRLLRSWDARNLRRGGERMSVEMLLLDSQVMFYIRRLFNDFPIDEAVPMAFQMGADNERIRSFLSAGNDWREPLCRGSYGISTDEPLKINFKSNRRFYYFNPKPWKKSDLENL